MKNPEVYISIDVEADGPIPGVNSMLSFGAAAFILAPDKPEGWSLLCTFSENLLPLPGAVQDPETMAWWAGHPEAWAEATGFPQRDPAVVMPDFADWIRGLPTMWSGRLDPKTKPVLVGNPILYDGMFLYWYTIRFAGYPAPFGHQGIDLRSVAWERLGGKYRETGKRDYPKRWFEGAPKHSHRAIDDAIEQGTVFMNMLKERP